MRALPSFPTRRSSDLVALTATFMAVASVKDRNITLRMNQAQAKAIDTWNYYQAKSMKQNLAEATLDRSEEHTSELQSHHDLVCRLLHEKKNNKAKATC